MIITVPEYKKIHHQTTSINESDLFDDVFNDLDDATSSFSSKMLQLYENEVIKPEVIKILEQLDVENYEIKCTGDGILVDVHDHLYLSNCKLNRMGMLLFHFDRVDGSCNFSGNDLSDWSAFPYTICGNCYANFNNIKNFDGAPFIGGKLIANKQNHKTDYPLTQENYIKIVVKGLKENEVYAVPVNRYGILLSITESDNSCIIKFDDNTKLKFKLNEVEYLGNLENLVI